MKMIVVVVLVTGCAGGSEEPRRAALEALPALMLTRGDDAISLVATTYAISPDAARVTWTASPLPARDDGVAVNGTALGCDLWVEWWGSAWTSGAAADGPAISYTSLAHEMAHCALWLQGDADAGHVRSDWWSPGGRVEQAIADLVVAGL